MPRWALAVVAVVAGTGCVRHAYWSKPDATPELWARELLACEESVTPAWSFSVGAAAGISQDQAWRRRRTLCLQARGWRRYYGKARDGTPPPPDAEVVE